MSLVEQDMQKIKTVSKSSSSSHARFQPACGRRGQACSIPEERAQRRAALRRGHPLGSSAHAFTCQRASCARPCRS